MSGEVGRIRVEALDFLRINVNDQTPKSGSRMDFGEKRVYFQKKFEAEIGSPSLRERKWKVERAPKTEVRAHLRALPQEIRHFDFLVM